MSKSPINIELMDVEAFITANNILPVTSEFITEPSTSRFHPEGLYSESIFGPVSSDERMVRFGYIDLHTRVMHPVVWKNIQKLRRFYYEICSASSYAVFDTKEKDFVPAQQDNPNADTGYEFFISHLRQIKFNRGTSLNRQDRVEILEKYQDERIFLTKCLVAPAGMRDYRVDASGRASVEEVNKLYASILRYAKAIPSGMGSHSAFNPIRLAIQKKLEELYTYLQNLVSGPQGGKEGLLQKTWGSRAVTLSARDVISAAGMGALSPDDVKFHKIDETKVPLFMAAKMFEPVVIFQLRRLFFQHLITTESDQMALLNPKTLSVEYRPLSPSGKDKILSSVGLSGIISRFEEAETRSEPFYVYDEDENPYYLYLVYDDNSEVYMFRSISSFKAQYEETTKKQFDISKIHPLTVTELLTVATWAAVQNKFVVLTRYPVVGVASTYVSRVHLITTEPSRTVTLKSEFTLEGFIIPEYPVLTANYVDSVIPHPSRLKGLGGDHDGDTVSVHSIMSEEACQECEKYLTDVSSIVAPDRSISVLSPLTDLLPLVVHNLMRQP